MLKIIFFHTNKKDNFRKKNITTLFLCDSERRGDEKNYLLDVKIRCFLMKTFEHEEMKLIQNYAFMVEFTNNRRLLKTNPKSRKPIVICTEVNFSTNK